MGSDLGHDVLYRTSQFLDDRTRMNLALANKSTYDMIHRVHLRENLIKLQGEHNGVIFIRGYAYPWAIRFNKVSLLEEIFDCAGDDLLRELVTKFKPDDVCNTREEASALKKKWDLPTSFFRRTVCDSLYSGHTAALEILMRRIPDVFSRELVLWASLWFTNAARGGQAKLLRIFHEAGFPNMEWQGDGFADDLTETARSTRYGAVFRVLVDMGADRSPLTTFMDGATLLHEWAVEGTGDEDLFSVFVENGMDLNKVAITTRSPMGNPNPDRFGFTPLELACQFKNTKTMEILLSLGADYAGSFKSSSLQSESEESAFSPWKPTTPLHALFETPDRHNNSEAAEVWENAENAERSMFIYLREHRVMPNDRLCKSMIPMMGGVDTCRHLKLMENLVAYAEVLLSGVGMLVAHDPKDHINTRVQGLGTPLEHFLAHAAKMRLHHDFLAEQGPSKISNHECPLEFFYGRSSLDEVLGRICDLLLDAGADIPFENYDEGKGGRGSARLQQLLSLRWFKKLAAKC